MVAGDGRRGRARIWRVAIALTLMFSMLAVTTTAGSAFHEEPFTEIEITFTITDIDQPGEATVSPDGIHVTGEVHSNSVTGSITGDALATVTVDWAGPCDVEALTCEGQLDQWVAIEMTDETGRWSGNIATVYAPDVAPSGAGLLVGHGGNADHALLLDTIVSEDDTSTTMSGYIVYVERPQAGVTFTSQMCAVGGGNFSGGFLAGGILDDSGSANGSVAVIGFPVSSGVVGAFEYASDSGVIQSIVVEQGHESGLHDYGNVLILGIEGLYEGMYGYGHTVASLYEDDGCAEGFGVRTHWIGKVFWTRTLFEGELPLIPVEEPSVHFASPEDGATVTSPVQVEMMAVNFTIEPAGEVHDGAGHFHIMIDVPCVAPGEVIPSDANHLHYGQAQTSAELELEPGEHTLCLQAGNGAHVALDLTDTITITVEAGEDDGDGGDGGEGDGGEHEH